MGQSSDADAILQKVVGEVLSPMYSLAVGISILYFLYGVLMFIVNANEPEKRNAGKSHLLYGTIGLFIILSVGGILMMFNTIFGGVFVY